MTLEKTPEAIIFDMDGLLVASETVWHMGENALLAERGHHITDEQRTSIVGLRVDAFMSKIRDMFNLSDTVEALVSELNERMLGLIPTEVKPMPGAREILAYVVENNIPYAIASNSGINVINATLETQGWGDLFPVRCTADDEAHGKPAPDVYLRAALRLNVDPAKCIALEDSPNGAKAVIAAGMTCFAVPDLSHADPSMFTEITPHVFNDLHEALVRIRALHEGNMVQ